MAAGCGLMSGGGVGRRGALVLIGAGLAGLQFPRTAVAHPADELRGLLIGLMSASKASEADGLVDVDVGLLIMNQAGEAATLRGGTVEGAKRVRVLETVSVLGLETERQVDFFKLDPGETRILQPPEGRISVEGLPMERLGEDGFVLALDFGPAGLQDVVVRLDEALSQTPAVE